MNCHRCINLRYDGKPYGHCTHPNHPEVVFVPRKDRKGPGSRSRPYNKGKCADFVEFRRCSNCRNWIRGKYYRDGSTPASRGKCGIGLVCSPGVPCRMWSERTAN